MLTVRPKRLITAQALGFRLTGSEFRVKDISTKLSNVDQVVYTARPRRRDLGETCGVIGEKGGPIAAGDPKVYTRYRYNVGGVRPSKRRERGEMCGLL